VFTLPDNGEDGKRGRKQAWYTFEHGLQLMVCGDSRRRIFLGLLATKAPSRWLAIVVML
jgi:hypothetical protein